MTIDLPLEGECFAEAMRDVILAIETSTSACSVGLRVGAEVFSRHEVLARRHQERLPTMIDELLAESGIGAEDLSGVAFGCGPGSFTGLRLAAATAQAWGLAHDLPVLAVSSLQALALRAAWEFPNACEICVLVKARIGEVYRADFDWSGETLERMGNDRRCKASRVRFQTSPGQVLRLVGDGCLGLDSAGIEIHPEMLPSAEAVLDLVHEVLPTSPEMALPAYLQPDSDWAKADQGSP